MASCLDITKRDFHPSYDKKRFCTTSCRINCSLQSSARGRTPSDNAVGGRAGDTTCYNTKERGLAVASSNHGVNSDESETRQDQLTFAKLEQLVDILRLV
ncbi:hypothetical protein J6590_057211 [Homalodisca vitripennis]|nr:hypothetical protein J6590_057211 [Homalodisca vitripennis]